MFEVPADVDLSKAILHCQTGAFGTVLMTFSNVQNLTMLIVLKLTDSLSKNEREAVHMLPK
ncbi:hypothetical protein [Cytobacillus firmus]|uniref:hypothetical protein n=1 Tax=Cytobacillus firmus TaxID=1399 RepID=UPI000E2080B5|nr:hypothetical protein [Cytobacillus firmus]MBG9558968.1 hypothetical protein [Cytobacillus firmus]MEC1895614.1 hypothetical protein [Cytobacillus firmus]